ncbi:MAG: substrate-binding domain-containing protein [Clostridiales bacterium]|nr:substrate-binding domain-containing protein [Clostridiales bacterium]
MKGRVLGAIAVAVLICTGLGACAGGAQPEIIGNFEFTQENYPRMGGSLAALPLGEAVTATVLGIDRRQTGDFILFEGSTTSNYRALVDGRFDMLLAYEPSLEAVEYAKEQGFELEMVPIGRDALVFIANKANPVQGLTDGQIRGIYRGEITNWSEVGGKDAAIVPYQRNKDSGSQTLFDKLVNLGDDLMKPPSDHVVGSMIGLLEVVAEYDNSADALGYTVYYYLANMEKEKLERTKILAVDGVECSNDTIRSGKYPYVNDFYAVIQKGLPEDAPARVLFNWICSAQGKELIERENYVVP